MDLIRNILIGIGFLFMLVIGSCTMLGMGAVSVGQAVVQKAGPAIEEAKREAERERLERHNERMNRRAAMYDSDYDDSSE